MDMAYKEAVKAMKEDEVPVGAVIVKDGIVVARAHNKKEKNNNPIAHAEIECIRKANKKLNDWYLKDCEMYVTLEPCTMCVGALINARVKCVYYGARDLKGGALGGLYNLMNQEGFNHLDKEDEEKTRRRILRTLKLTLKSLWLSHLTKVVWADVFTTQQF